MSASLRKHEHLCALTQVRILLGAYGRCNYQLFVIDNYKVPAICALDQVDNNIYIHQFCVIPPHLAALYPSTAESGNLARTITIFILINLYFNNSITIMRLVHMTDVTRPTNLLSMTKFY